MTPVWIALFAVAVALIPAFTLSTRKAADGKKRGDGGADGGSSWSGGDSGSGSDCGGDGGGGGCD